MTNANEQTNIRGVAETFRALANEKTWRGTITKLAEALEDANAECPTAPARLAIWLRRNETALWWSHRISMTFSRNGRRRLIQLSLRDSNVIERRRHQAEQPGEATEDTPVAHTRGGSVELIAHCADARTMMAVVTKLEQIEGARQDSYGNARNQSSD